MAGPGVVPEVVAEPEEIVGVATAPEVVAELETVAGPEDALGFVTLIPPPASQVHLVLLPLELRVVYQVVMYQVFLGLVVLCQV